MSAEAAFENGDFQQALAVLEYETSGPAVDPSRLLMRFHVEVRLQRFDAAQATLRRLLSAAPDVAAPMAAFAAAAQAEESATLRRRDPSRAARGAALGLPPPHQLALMKAAVCHASGDAQGATAALAEAAALTPATSGTITRVGGATQRFTAIADSDALTGATLPVYDGDKLLDLAFSELSAIAFLQPTTSLDVMWSVADIELVDGRRLRGRVPSLYPGSGVAADGPVRAGRQTTWQHHRGYAEALGQRDWSVTLADGGGTLVGILGVHRIDFDNPRRAARAPGVAGKAAASSSTVPGWAMPAAVLGAFAGVAVFLYLGMLGGRAGPEAVFGLLGVAVIAGVAGVVAGFQTIARKRTGFGIALLAIAGLGIVVGIGSVVMDNAYRQSHRVENSPPPSPPPRKAYLLRDYGDLCESKDPFPGAKRYEKTARSPSKVAFFKKHLDDKEPKWVLDQKRSVGVLAAKDEEVDEVELVVCSELKRQGKPGYCRYAGAEVTIYDMTHTVRVIEATTGEVLDEETFELDRRTEGCASSVTGSYYTGADSGPKLLSVLLPLEGAGIELPKIEHDWELDAVCSGSPFPQVAPYDPSSGKRGVRFVYFPTDDQDSVTQDVPAGVIPMDQPARDPMTVQLVACMTGKPKKKKVSCEFTTGRTLEMYDGEIEVAVYEAATRKLVETKSFKATSSVCPFTHKFYGSVDKRMSKAEPALAAYLKTLEGE